MLNAIARRRVVALVGRDEQSRHALVDAGRWQRAYSAAAKVVLVEEPVRALQPTSDLARFCAWATGEAEFAVTPHDVVTCGAMELLVQLERLSPAHGDLVVCPASPDVSAPIGSLSFHAIWSLVAPRKSRLLLSRAQSAPRRALVVTDGTPRTLPVLEAAFELADRFAVKLSHLDTKRVTVLRSTAIDARRAAKRDSDDARAPGYLRVVHDLLAAVRRAPRELRPELMLIGAGCEDGGGTASALATNALPCSVLMVPCA